MLFFISGEIRFPPLYWRPMSQELALGCQGFMLDCCQFLGR
jgi:hypothetical protein